MDTEPGANRRERVVDWLASHPDLPHLFARLSELVLVHGYATEDLVVIPRAEVDRRETSAFTAGWAEAVSDELPRIRREYEKRVADAYTQGQGDARGIRRPQRRADAGQTGARVIALPFARLLEPPAAVVEAEERVRRERELFERQSGLEPEQEAEPGQHGEPEPVHQKEPAPDVEPDVLVTAQESRTRRNAQPVRKVVRGKGGRPIVPPLGVPAQPTSGGERRGTEPADPEPRAGKGRRLSERARALADELTAERAQEAPPESVP
ncbi:hypothetical protein [Streptomyces sp. NBC_00233]|uniref:hypothetical protein n=1 Tax=Streptomyces sp. NBC_00233 TaxID=2975686 RepID=UPI00224D216E|nr:hypothetical protein [Streptomyces sp. NBC_00233]MCX5228042.1 hypothetical protein [Streptomyces sp. NBC_00233]